MDLQELTIYWQVVRKRLWLVGLLVAVTVGAILLTYYLSKPVYKASALFQVTAPLPAEVSLVSEYRTSASREELVHTGNNFMAVLQSDFVIQKVIEKLGLGMDVGEIRQHMVIESDPQSDMVKLVVTASDPKLAAAIANTTINTASQYFGELSAGSITANKQVIKQQLSEKKQELDTAQAALIQFQIKNKIGSLGGILRSQEDLIIAAKSNRDRALAEGREEDATGYDRVIAEREQELQDLVLLNSQYATLQGAVNRIDATYTSLLDKETEAELKENEILSARFIRVIPAYEPSRPLPRVDPRVLILGAVVSFVVGIILAFVLEHLERRVAATGKAGQDSLLGTSVNANTNEPAEASA